jgi:hypothetical protein
MHAVARAFVGKGAKALFDALTKHKAHMEQILYQIKGFFSYTIIETSDGCISVTVCQDKAASDESQQKAWDWIAKNASTTGVEAPTVSKEFAGPALLLHEDTAKNAIGNIPS